MSKIILNNKILAKKYSRALYEQANQEKISDKIWQDLQLMALIINDSKKIRAIILNHNVPEKKKNILLKIILQNSKVSALIERFLTLLVKNNRFYLLPAIIANYQARLQQDNNEIEAELYSSILLQKQHIENISTIIAQKLNKKIIIKNIIDERILGGFMMKIGSKMIDCSLAKRLLLLEKESQKLITLK